VVVAAVTVVTAEETAATANAVATKGER
jgi:hypothetical protein